MNLSSSGCGGDPLSVQDYVNTYCVSRSQKSGTQVPIGQIESFPLKVIMSTITRVASVSYLHFSTCNHMHLVLECLRNVVFD